MPLDTNSDTWRKANSRDALGVHIIDLLFDNQELAFSVAEIEEYLLSENKGLFPDGLVGENSLDGSRAARRALITSILIRRYWHSEVRFKFIQDGGSTDEGLYFTYDGPGINPIAEIDDLREPDIETSRQKLSGRFYEIEQEMNRDISDIEERLEWIEFRLYEELGAY